MCIVCQKSDSSAHYYYPSMAQGSEMMRSATNVDSMVEDSAFINEIRMVVVDYIQTAVAGIDLPVRANPVVAYERS